MIEYDETQLIRVIFRWRGSVFGQAFFFAIPSAILGVTFRYLEQENPDVWVYSGLPSGFDKSQIWNITTFILGILLSMRTNRAIARFWEGTGLLHQMRGEWFDSLSCLVAFSNSARTTKPDEVLNFRHTMVRLMSLCHASGLEEISEESCDPLETIDTLGLNDETLQQLQRCKADYEFNRVEVILHMLQTLITQALNDGVLQIAPPILSRVYQTLSRGLVNLLNAKKIVDTKFPFPYAQTISALLMVHVVITPLMVSSFVDNKGWCALFSFLPVFGMFCLLLVAIELENPFGDDVNDLPLTFFQEEMNRCLLMLLEDNVDLIPSLSRDRALTDFQALMASMVPEQQAFENDLAFNSSLERSLQAAPWRPTQRASCAKSNRVARKSHKSSSSAVFFTKTKSSADLSDCYTRRMSKLSETSAKVDVESKWDPTKQGSDRLVPETCISPTVSIGQQRAASEMLEMRKKSANSISFVDENLQPEAELPLSSSIGGMVKHATEQISRQIDLIEAHLAKMVNHMEVRNARRAFELSSARSANIHDREAQRQAHKLKDAIPREMGIDTASVRKSSLGLCCSLYGQSLPDQLLVVPAASVHRGYHGLDSMEPVASRPRSPRSPRSPR